MFGNTETNGDAMDEGKCEQQCWQSHQEHVGIITTDAGVDETECATVSYDIIMKQVDTKLLWLDPT